MQIPTKDRGSNPLWLIFFCFKNEIEGALSIIPTFSAIVLQFFWLRTCFTRTKPTDVLRSTCNHCFWWKIRAILAPSFILLNRFVHINQVGLLLSIPKYPNLRLGIYSCPSIKRRLMFVDIWPEFCHWTQNQSLFSYRDNKKFDKFLFNKSF